MAPKVAIIYYSMYGHLGKLAQAEKKGIEASGGTVDLYQIEETLPREVLTKMHAPTQDASIPFITPDILKTYDAFLFGIPTRFGNYSAQWKTFIDGLGQLWISGALHGKYFGLFVSTATPGGGQEATCMNALSSWIHLGLIYVPLGYATTFQLLSNLDEVRGGSPWGAGTFTSGDGSRQPTTKELELATAQGKSFWKHISRVNFGA
ncbi:NAD(P)H:quinone oxidoreductase, type IV [Exophiala spinifera]|uniref:NAD(P)H:quinone oxidoreductase, type IV n=1 Tax=Exophiala spinifera TaxID=91928 RepID=A0A0D2AYG4_9EURO|nr:NAD(P)H:quinone oxidoreductase, type IV [Exophiala spinifera]KIW11758.1 NAD(P)H:quinone oxidoreductase, type IV [Exophiala spinifera]